MGLTLKIGEYMKEDTMYNCALTRRDFLRGISLGTAGLAVTVAGITDRVSATPAAVKSRVTFVTGTERRDMVYQLMKPFEKEIREGIRGKQVIIKPNFVVTSVPLCATHPDAVRGILDFLKPIYNRKVIIAESTVSRGGTMEGYENYGYMPLKNEYNVDLIDLNLENSTYEWVLDRNLHPTAIPIINSFLDHNNYFISVTRLKTHDRVVATLSIKNMVMSAPLHKYNVKNYKGIVHPGGARWANYNMFLIARKIRPNFSILESVEGMQGNGPVRGFPMEHGVALAGIDPVAVDSIGAGLMSIDVNNIGYIKFCADAGLGQLERSNIEIIGGKDPANYVQKYQLHERIEQELEWKGEMNW